MNHSLKSVLAVWAAGLLAAAPLESAPAAADPPLSYADLADVALAVPVAAHVRLRRASLLKPSEAGNPPAGFSRFYVEADLVSLIRGPGGVPAQVNYLADFPNGPKGKAAKPAKKGEYILLASTIPGRPGTLRLSADGQLPFTAARADMLRSILREATAADAPPRITGIGKSFHVPGSLAGESETQIFLQTEGGRPVSLNVLRRPGETPRWALALSEIVDEAAQAPKPNSLLWYRLACGLPRSLPAQSLSEAEPDHRAAIEADYRLVLGELGTCTRSRR
jgi:hypothetical protein